MTSETVPDAPQYRQSWAGAPSLIQIEACQQGGKRGAQLWGIMQDYRLVTCYQFTPGGNWSGWQE